MLYAVKVENLDYKSTRWFLIVAESETGAHALCTDSVSRVVEVTDDIERMVNERYNGYAMLEMPEA